VQRSASISTSRGSKWKLLHSLWIVWTFLLGFFSWLAFAYIGIRARHPRWLLWAALYATPLMVYAIITANLSQRWANVTLYATLILGVVSVVHALLVRKEYLLRLDLIQRETSHISVTSMGRKWEWLHSLWIVWTLPLGFTSWIAFIYIAWRARRVRWLLWGLLYFVAFAAMVATNLGSQPTDVTIGLMIVAGIVSVVHAFAVRSDYLVRLENRMREVAGADEMARRLEAEYQTQTGASPADERSEQSAYSGSSDNATVPDKPEISREQTTASPTETPPQEPAEVSSVAGSKSKLSELVSIADTYPLPVAYSWSMLEGFWDPRDRYREQLRHAENMLAFLGSVSLAVLDDQDYEKAQLDLKLPWQGGISFGAWKLIVQRCAKVFRDYRDHSLAADIHRLKIGSENKGFGADIATLISARNDFHHGRGPVMEDDIVEASNDAQERLQRCMEALSFFTQYPIRLVQDFDVDRRNHDFLLKCLRLEGDGPGFLQEKIRFPRAMPRGDLMLDLGDENWVQLYPFIVASNCPHCRYRETYFIDRWNDRKNTTLMKSFERGHTEESRDISETLALLAEGQKSES
jgi:hypothetical protein